MVKFKPVDIITIVTIIGCLILMGLEKGTDVTKILLAFAAYYFGKSTSENFYHNNSNKKNETRNY